MRTRLLRFGLYADEEGLAWAGSVVDRATALHNARTVGRDVVRTLPGSGTTTADLYDHLAQQWAWEHPGRSSGAREPVELRVRLVCSLRTWRAVRKAVLRGLCPRGAAPHVCRVPWCAA
ncbi:MULTISPECIES: hypothetical protein [Streptomyces]|uniref:Uncharacterized protein n=1 Tax=Streptomyces edwardsiae TaxID=3075527 RepID=A0ABU2QP18_9ACTN|nr:MULTISPECIES: hypothetical protein [unclassified Streptomyces]MDT0405215.1 hypothetical protein [Streptomyces sp. DSM 41635]